MTRRRILVLAASLLAMALVWLPVGFGRGASADTLPLRLTDQEFWTLASESSEPDGTFRSDNLVSNEAEFQTVIPALSRTATAGRVYLGVGPEQNFTYIAAVRPAMAFVVDVRRRNLDLHLVYKALFELAADRADFVSRLFSRKRPAGLSNASSALDIFSAYDQLPPSQALYDQNLEAIETQLATKHGFTLSADDRRGIEFVYLAWFQSGPDLHYDSTNGGGRFGGGRFPTYADLMTATDGNRQNRSYLSTEETFRFLKDLETRNMVVPVVGNFAGPRALRAVAAYLKQRQAIVSAFYLSNVEQYLRQDGIWDDFCANVAALPLDRTSTFIRAARGGFSGQPGGRRGGLTVELEPMMPEVAGCASAR